MKIMKMAAASAVLAGLALPALAQDAASQDASCLVLSMAATQSTNPQAKLNGQLAQSYFMGRLDSRGAPNLAALLNTQIAAMTPARAKAESLRCTQLIDNRVKAMRATLSQIKPPA